MASYSVGLPSGSPPPVRAATSMFLISLANSLPRLASMTAFLCLVVAHLECPLTGLPSLRSVRPPEGYAYLICSLRMRRSLLCLLSRIRCPTVHFSQRRLPGGAPRRRRRRRPAPPR